MLTDLLAFVSYAHTQHQADGHRDCFECCRRRNCRRARQIEIYLILTGQWVEAAYGWLAAGGRG